MPKKVWTKEKSDLVILAYALMTNQELLDYLKISPATLEKFAQVNKLRKAKTDLSTIKFGKLRPIENTGIKNHNAYVWRCVCECGKERRVRSVNLTNGTVKSCGCEDQRILRHKKGSFGNIGGSYWSKIISRAKERGINFELSAEYAWNLYLVQNKKCALSGIPISFSEVYREYSNTASLDRIDSSKGYIEGNVQWVHKHINQMKLNHDESYFISLCRMIVDYQEDKSKKGTNNV